MRQLSRADRLILGGLSLAKRYQPGLAGWVMAFSTTRILDWLLGTAQNRRTRVVQHLVFWLVYAKWIALTGAWLSDAAHPQATWLMSAQAALTVLLTFYTVSFAVHRARTSGAAWLRGLTILLISFGLYCLSNYYLYGYVAAAYPDMPAYFHRLVGNLSQHGPWTFLHNGLLYYHATRFLLLLFLPFALQSGRALVQARVRTVALEKDNLQLELEFLRAQINPHFLFNTLNSVYALVEDKEQTAATLVLALAGMMRYALYDSAVPHVAVGRELAFIREYLDIQQIRHQRRLRLDVQLAPDLGAQRIPPLLLVTFLENAIKHGVDQLLHEAWVQVRAYRDETGTFCFAVSNTMPPITNVGPPAEGIGLRNTRRRLALLYPTTHSLQIRTDATRHHVLLRLWS
jgi:hypothetical protein